ncbi:hypothetical protein F0562_017364 [Nyssa sinensis]|uniref:Disease resistance protein winged helix domain-containing protein n=1 Tax=Nyssa sinensis TaxID=561372 RepID=A0A5J4ZIN1_9ASTE|nr:hypothetical protein F0562_017364 [Nyssa sinensis]
MAESFVNNVFDKLSSFALEEVYLAWNVRNELQKLSKTSTSIEEFLWSNADQQQQQASLISFGENLNKLPYIIVAFSLIFQFTKSNRNADQQQQQAKSRQDEWHEKMEDIFYDADDVLDEYQIELSKPQVFQGSISTKKLLNGRSLLTGAENGSTRSKLVALAVGTFPSCNLELLHDDKCSSIFLKWAFRNRSQEINPKLVEIGKRIVRKCKGVPLAVRTLGCMLYSKTHERQWLSVIESEIWKLKQKDDDILPALRLSYNDLEPKIKRCFAYCSIFPKDSEINTYQLIQMWMAQGLIKLEDDSDQTQELEDVGMDYFRTLCSKSFFQDVKDHGFFFTFKMHDLLHDLALSVAQTKHSTIKSPAEKVSKNVQHVSFYDPDSPADELLIPLREKKKVRSIYFQFNRVKPAERSFVETCISRFEFLRLMDLRESCFEALPSSIGEMDVLRCLQFFAIEQVSKLVALPQWLQGASETLNHIVIEDCLNFATLPEWMENLIFLQKLEVSGCQRLTSLPEFTFSLGEIRISQCPELIRECQRETGKD